MTEILARGATYEAAPNIALVKYWGVRDPSLGLPYNSSLSVTLDRFRTRTTVRFDPRLSGDRFLLNRIPQNGGPLEGVHRFLDRVRALAEIETYANVRSTNDFQTASGLASSASGFAALAGAASSAAGLRLSDQQLSQLARLGSGSACRSIFGGFVEWKAGSHPDGSDCYAHPLYRPSHWPSLVDLVTMVEGAPSKEVRSAVAMQASVRTSPEYAERLREVPRRIQRIRRAIGARDATRLFPLIMEECDSFRKVCETTTPSLDYLTATSRAILGQVRTMNESAGRPLAAYTHDAGAHVHVFTLRRDLPTVRRHLGKIPGIREIRIVNPGPGGRRVTRS
ncbi:MAG: diphosphomevalonate decarboxylase [Thermoplasmata archaeon]